MKFSDMMPSADQLKLIQGIEADLLKRRKAGTLSGMAALAWALLQVFGAIFSSDYLNKIKEIFKLFSDPKLQNIVTVPVLSLLIFAFLLAIYFISRWTGLFLKEAKEPFRYTFWIDPFKAVENTPGERFTLKNNDRLHLLHLDLMRKLNDRIGRLSLLNVEPLQSSAKESLTAHIQVRGYYAMKESCDNEWVLEVTPCIRIGPPDKPETLAHSATIEKPHSDPPDKWELTASEYEQLVEQLCSWIATEIYNQIKNDVEKKIGLFPTGYLRAAALYYEAKDFERSNTVESYDLAIELYKKAIRYFEIRACGTCTTFILAIPLLWRTVADSQILEALARTGYARCLVYRRILSTLSGRRQNPVFVVPDELEKAAEKLLILHNKIHGKEWRIAVSPFVEERFTNITENHLMQESDINDVPWLAKIIRDKKNPFLRYLVEKIFTPNFVIPEDETEIQSRRFKKLLLKQLNMAIKGPPLFNEKLTPLDKLSTQTLSSLASTKLDKNSTKCLNRLHIENESGCKIDDINYIDLPHLVKIFRDKRSPFLQHLVEDIFTQNFVIPEDETEIQSRRFKKLLLNQLNRAIKGPPLFNKQLTLFDKLSATTLSLLLQPKLGSDATKSINRSLIEGEIGFKISQINDNNITQLVKILIDKDSPFLQHLVEDIFTQNFVIPEDEAVIQSRRFKKLILKQLDRAIKGPLLVNEKITLLDKLSAQTFSLLVQPRAGINSTRCLNRLLIEDMIGLNIDEINQHKHFMAFMTFPKDAIFRRKESLFAGMRKALFETYTTASISYSQLGAAERAKKFLTYAKTVEPVASKENALWLLAAAEANPQIDLKLQLLRQATENADSFEIAQYQLAYYTEMQLRRKNEITFKKIESVLREYREVQKINPGNIGALAAQGYLLWLLGDLEGAQKIFIKGLRVKDVVRQTFVGDLCYGLARIFAEKGKFDRSHDMYLQAVSADPGVAAYTCLQKAYNFYYVNITPGILERYLKFTRRVHKRVSQAKKATLVSTINTVLCYVFNDFGNACLNYFHRFGDLQKLKTAIAVFKSAINKCHENVTAYYSLSNACSWDYNVDMTNRCLDDAYKLSNCWPPIMIESIKTQCKEHFNSIIQKQNKLSELINENADLLNKKNKLIADETKSNYNNDLPVVGANYKEIQNINSKMSDNHEEINMLPDAIRGLKEKTPIIFSKLNNLMDMTKFISLFEGMKIDEFGNGVDQFCNSAIDKASLDENDIESLLVWAEMLSYSTSETAIIASERLCGWMENICPENFSIMYIQNTINSNCKNSLPKKKIIENNIRTSIRNWLCEDSVSYVALRWAHDEFMLEDFESYCRAAIDLNDRTKITNEVYLDILDKKYSQEGKYEERVLIYTEACNKYNNNKTFCTGLMNALNDYGNILYSAGKYNEAIEKYHEASNVTPENDVLYSNIALALEQIWFTGRDKDIVDEAIKNLSKAIDINNTEDSYNKRRNKLIIEKNAFNSLGPVSSNFTFLVKPITMELSKCLCPYILDEGTNNLKKEFVEMIEAMRDRIKERYGITVPAISFTESQAMDWSYSIRINNVLVASAAMPQNKRFYAGDRAGLANIQINGEVWDFASAGIEGCWIDSDDWSKIEMDDKAGRALWQIMEYPIRHLEAVLRLNLHEVVGHQEVARLLESTTHKEDVKNRKLLTQLTRAVRGLLWEEVPISEFEKIVDKFLALKREGKETSTIIAEIRLLPEIRQVLPGNDEKYIFLNINDNLERYLDKNGTAMIVPREAHDNLVAAIRNRIVGMQNPAIIVGNPLLRPKLRQLALGTFPMIPILARQELLPELEANISGEIRID